MFIGVSAAVMACLPSSKSKRSKHEALLQAYSSEAFATRTCPPHKSFLTDDKTANSLLANICPAKTVPVDTKNLTFSSVCTESLKVGMRAANDACVQGQDILQQEYDASFAAKQTLTKYFDEHAKSYTPTQILHNKEEGQLQVEVVIKGMYVAKQEIRKILEEKKVPLPNIFCSTDIKNFIDAHKFTDAERARVVSKAADASSLAYDFGVTRLTNPPADKDTIKIAIVATAVSLSLPGTDSRDLVTEWVLSRKWKQDSGNVADDYLDSLTAQATDDQKYPLTAVKDQETVISQCSEVAASCSSLGAGLLLNDRIRLVERCVSKCLSDRMVLNDVILGKLSPAGDKRLKVDWKEFNDITTDVAVKVEQLISDAPKDTTEKIFTKILNQMGASKEMAAGLEVAQEVLGAKSEAGMLQQKKAFEEGLKKAQSLHNDACHHGCSNWTLFDKKGYFQLDPTWDQRKATTADLSAMWKEALTVGAYSWLEVTVKQSGLDNIQTEQIQKELGSRAEDYCRHAQSFLNVCSGEPRLKDETFHILRGCYLAGLTMRQIGMAAGVSQIEQDRLQLRCSQQVGGELAERCYGKEDTDQKSHLQTECLKYALAGRMVACEGCHVEPPTTTMISWTSSLTTTLQSTTTSTTLQTTPVPTTMTTSLTLTTTLASTSLTTTACPSCLCYVKDCCTTRQQVYADIMTRMMQNYLKSFDDSNFGDGIHVKVRDNMLKASASVSSAAFDVQITGCREVVITTTTTTLKEYCLSVNVGCIYTTADTYDFSPHHDIISTYEQMYKAHDSDGYRYLYKVSTMSPGACKAPSKNLTEEMKAAKKDATLEFKPVSNIASTGYPINTTFSSDLPLSSYSSSGIGYACQKNYWTTPTTHVGLDVTMCSYKCDLAKDCKAFEYYWSEKSENNKCKLIFGDVEQVPTEHYEAVSCYQRCSSPSEKLWLQY